jgi:hypothetical protein
VSADRANQADANHPDAARARPAYAPRRPEQTVLHGVVRAELETFLAHAAARERSAPSFVERELRAYLRCGVLAHGFVRVHCPSCGLDRVVGFSCKGRGFCPSCGGRRMADTAAHLVDRVLPRVPVRQWVLSLPFALRYRLAYDASLASAVLATFVRTVFASLRRRARSRGLTRIQCGSVTFVQRAGDALNLNVHFHSLVLDGVYARSEAEAPRFHALAPPDDAEVARVVRQIAHRLARLLESRGLGRDANAEDADPLPCDQPLLAALYAASVSGRIATGPRRGQRVLRVGDLIDVEDLPVLTGPRCASASGLSLHANVAVPARDRKRLERLARYTARPPLASTRLSRLADGRLLYRLKHRWRDGTTAVVFTPQELIEKLAALVPAPRFHLVRYHGVLAPAARERARVVPARAESETSALSRSRLSRPCPAHAERPPPPTSGAIRRPATDPTPGTNRSPAECSGDPRNPGRTACRSTRSAPRSALDPSRPRRLAWSELLRRVFAIDLLECSRCHGRLEIVAAIHSPHATQAILASLDLPSRAPPLDPARADDEEPPLDLEP